MTAGASWRQPWLALATLALGAGSRAEAAPEGQAPVAWVRTVQVANGPAVRGPWRQNESSYDWVDDPSVALASDGTVAIAWVDQGRKDVLVQRYGPAGPRLPAPTDVSRSPAVFSWLPRVVLLEGGAVLAVLWQEIVFSGGSHGGEIFFARSTDGGRTFSPPSNLSRSLAGDGKGRLDPRRWDNGSLDLIGGGGDVLYAAWTEYEGGLWFSRSEDGGASFSTPLRIPGTDGARPARGPSLAAGPDGAVYLAWAVGEDPTADVQVTVSRDRGRAFEPPRPAARTGGRQDAPRLAVDGRGTVHLVLAEGGGAGRPSRILYARAAAGTLDFTAPRPVLEGRAPDQGAVHPELVAGPDGSLWVMAELRREGEPRPRGLLLSASLDGGRTFSAGAAVPGTLEQAGTNGGEQGRFMRRLAVGPGEVVVGHSTFQRGVASEVLLFRGTRRP